MKMWTQNPSTVMNFMNYDDLVPGKRCFVKLVYNEVVSIASGNTVPLALTVAGNSVWDPNITLTGHSARGLAYLSTLYNRYYVVKSQCIFTVTNYTTANVNVAVPTLIAATTQSENINYLLTRLASGTDKTAEPGEARDIKFAQIYPYGSLGQKYQRKLVSFGTTARFFGPMKDIQDNTATSAVNGDPASRWCHEFYCYNQDGTATANVFVGFKCIYWTVFYQPKGTAGPTLHEDVEVPEEPASPGDNPIGVDDVSFDPSTHEWADFDPEPDP